MRSLHTRFVTFIERIHKILVSRIKKNKKRRNIDMLSFSQWQNKTRLAKTAAKISFKTVYTASLTN